MTNSPTPRRHLSMIVDDSPCDGSHGRFCPECAAINRWADSIKLDIDTFTKWTAAQIFILETETDDIAAWAWLPSQYDHCLKCDTRETHDHPTKKLITRAELKRAIDENLQSQLETYLDC